MLPKVNRLTKKKDFEIVFQKGKSIKNDFLVLKVFKNHLKYCRFGFIVSKKVSNKATVRNKVKRMLRDAIWREFENIDKSIDVIVIALPRIKGKEFSEIQKIINSLIKKIRIIIN